MAKRKRRKATTKRTARKSVKRTRRAKAAPRRAGSGGITQAVSGLRAHVNSLIAQRDALDAEIRTIEQTLQMLGGRPTARARGTGASGRGGPRTGSLKEYIINVLRGSGVKSVKDITAAVLKAGYPTKNKTLDKSVGIALAQMPMVQKVGRGQFRLK
jgi:hypothetical protein